MELKKINDNLFKCINLKKLKFKNVMMPFKISEYNNKFYLNIEIYHDDSKNNEILNYYKNIESLLFKTNEIEDINLSDLEYYSNIKTKKFNNKYCDLLKIQINKSKNSFITQYNKGNNTIFELQPQKYYDCDIEIGFVWINKNKYGILLKLININDVVKK